MAHSQPNILFIMTDHQRADSLGMVQAGIEITPNLNHLADRGAVFTRAYTSCPLCVPARTSLATGKYPTRTGVVCNGGNGLQAGNHKPIHQWLHETGYEVGHIGVDHIRLNPSLQERVEFSTWIGRKEYVDFLAKQGTEDAPQDRMLFKKKVIEWQGTEPVERAFSNVRTGPSSHSSECFLDSYYCKCAEEFINEPREKPFALFVYLWAPHPPLRVPKPYASRFDPASIELPPNVGVVSENEPPGRRKGVPAQLAESVTMDEWRDAWAAHLGLVNLADAGICRILETLEVSGQTDNTTVLFTSDHGDHLGQHSMYQKMEMYEQAINVPLILSGPRIKSQVVNTPVSHLDVLPTLLEYVGINIPEDLDGISLLESLESGAPLPERTVFSQFSGNHAKGDIRRAAITRRYKHVYDPMDEPELYDLAVDPLEMNNLASEPASEPIVRRLHEECKTWAQRTDDWVAF
ncbi:sulfatase-like hydrolase/transferase [Candidatus Hydrogenedentota bacterium]